MLLKKTLAVSGYITSIFGGGYVTYDYLQDKTIGDLLFKLGTKHSTEEEFQKSYNLLKDDSQFIQDINNGVTLSEQNGPDLLKNWCFSKYRLELTEDNVKKILPKVEKYCSSTEGIETKSVSSGASLNWRQLRKQIAKKGISGGGQLFVKVEKKGTERGRGKTFIYCWDANKNEWITSTSQKDCWKRDGNT